MDQSLNRKATVQSVGQAKFGKEKKGVFGGVLTAVQSGVHARATGSFTDTSNG